MSVGLLLSYPNGQKESRLVPISTEQGFQTYWLPASKLLGLRWVPLFRDGAPAEKEDIPDIIGELETMQKFMASAPPSQLPQDVAAQIAGRIDTLIAELQIAQNTPGIEVFIG